MFSIIISSNRVIRQEIFFSIGLEKTAGTHKCFLFFQILGEIRYCIQFVHDYFQRSLVEDVNERARGIYIAYCEWIQSIASSQPMLIPLNIRANDQAARTISYMFSARLSRAAGNYNSVNNSVL